MFDSSLSVSASYSIIWPWSSNRILEDASVDETEVTESDEEFEGLGDGDSASFVSTTDLEMSSCASVAQSLPTALKISPTVDSIRSFTTSAITFPKKKCIQNTCAAAITITRGRTIRPDATIAWNHFPFSENPFSENPF
ncbi:unnamed protein product [Lupinus luteus]|uniref:Uncharacterized protein n=1 Tax=Lupinus luteus TaxID=3873 RepID=A0AAV1XI29_LUPLU